MKIALIFAVLIALAVFAETAKIPKKPAAKKKGKKPGPGKNVNKKTNKPKKNPPKKNPAPPPFTGCISPESEFINNVLQKHIQAKLEGIWGSRHNRPWLEFKVMKYCWLAEVAKIVQKYQGRLSGVEAFNYKVRNRGNAKPDMSQLLEGLETQFEGKISAFVPMVINEFAVLPFGCSFTNGEVMEIDCLFLTENFFEFLVQLAQIGGKEVGPPSLIFLAPYLQRLLAE